MGELKSKTVVVAGAGRGIGRAVAEAAAAQGANVVISSRTKTELDRVEQAIREAGGTVVGVVADATDVESSALPAQAALQHFGRIDGWVNAVGGHRGDDRHPLDLTAELFNAHIQLNLTSALLGAQHAAKAMIDAGTVGTIINIGSGDSNHSGARVGYTAAKHGLVGLTKSLARHWGPQGVRVNCVCPGWTNTELNDWNLLGKAWGVTAEQAYQQAADQNLQKRILEPNEVAEMVTFLMSDRGSGVTGQIISVDGGYRV